MKKILDLISQEVMDAFAACGYDAAYGRTGISNRPDLCEYQCNGAMAAKKVYGKAPILIAQEVAAALAGSPVFEAVSYTHLDVYKRQAPYLRCRTEKGTTSDARESRKRGCAFW